MAFLQNCGGRLVPQRQQQLGKKTLRRGAAVETNKFGELSLPEGVVTALKSVGVRAPTPIQAACLGPLRSGRSGLLAAETGSGKSLAFLLPCAARLAEKGDGCVVVLAPTRELALQLATEASFVFEAFFGFSRVELLAVGSATTAGDLKVAQCVVGTPKQMLQTFAGRPRLIAKLGTVTSLVLDEVDALLPPPQKDRRSKASKARTKKKIVFPEASDAAKTIALVLKANASPELQVIGASATASRTTRDALRRALREDPYGRFKNDVLGIDEKVEVFRSREGSSDNARSIVVPSVVNHLIASLEKGADAAKAMRTAADVIERLQPKSTLVFVAKSSDFSVAAAARQLELELQTPVAPLHELLFEQTQESENPSLRRRNLEQGRRDLAEDFKNNRAPVLVTFEASARGLHFDKVDLVLVVGLPTSPASYLHLAGRAGRQFHAGLEPGNVVLLIPDKAFPVVLSWSKQLGGVTFAHLDLRDVSDQAVASESSPGDLDDAIAPLADTTSTVHVQ